MFVCVGVKFLIIFLKSILLYWHDCTYGCTCVCMYQIFTELLCFVLAGSGAPGTPGATGQPTAGEGGSNVVRKRPKTSSDPESDASESE